MANRKRSLYSHKRYWYHVSTTLNRKLHKLIPWDSDEGFNRASDEPEGKRICVSPTIEQCIVAIPYSYNSVLYVYRTLNKVRAIKSHGIFDGKVTDEAWIKSPTYFQKIGKIRFDDIEKELNIGRDENEDEDSIEVAEEKATWGELKESRKLLKWWEKMKISRFIERS